MRHSQLRAFHHVARAGGFSRAAEALNQTQPALSEQVRRLEQAHDVLLFHREGRQVRLTEVGEALFRLTNGYFEAEAEIAGFLTQSGAARPGHLRIIADSARHIAGALARFHAAHPATRVSLRTANTDEVLTALRNYEAEIGVIGTEAPGPDVEVFDLGASPIVAIAAPAQAAGLPGRIGPGDLARLPLVLREPGSRTRRQLEDAARAAGVRLGGAISVDGREAMREVVASGAGVGFISRAELGDDPRVRIIPIDLPGLDMPERLAILKSRRDVAQIRAFLRICAADGPPPHESRS